MMTVINSILFEIIMVSEKILLQAEAIIGFVNTNLSISEDGEALEFDIAVLQGDLRFNVLVDFTTDDGSALGK